MVLITQELANALNSPQRTSTVDEWVLGRDGYQCRAPGCGRSENLQVCQVDPGLPEGHFQTANLITVCSVCRPLWDLMGRGPFVKAEAEKDLPAMSA